MVLFKDYTHIYGFEEYNIVNIYNNVFKQNWDFHLSSSFMRMAGMYIIPRDLPVKIVPVPEYWRNGVDFEPSLCEDHPELLKTAKKVYTHPSCKLSRSLMSEKYKKCLNPHLSDAVVIPNPSGDELQLYTYAIFINEQAKILVIVLLDRDGHKDTIAQLEGVSEGEPLVSLVSCSLIQSYNNYTNIKAADVLNAGFMYCGDLLYVPNTHSYVMDILTSSIPTDKIVYEKTMQESLGTETNKLDYDSLTSIKDMLESSDANTVAAGLKSLSMMDWMHYSNSVKYIINMVDNSRWRYNNAVNSTSVKYMFRTLSNSSNRGRWPGSFNREIYSEDYKLFTELRMHYENISSDKLLDNMRFLEFMTTTAQGVLTPRIKERAV